MTAATRSIRAGSGRPAGRRALPSRKASGPPSIGTPSTRTGGARSSPASSGTFTAATTGRQTPRGHRQHAVRLLVTGAHGQLGRELTGFLHDSTHEVVG